MRIEDGLALVLAARALAPERPEAALCMLGLVLEVGTGPGPGFLALAAAALGLAAGWEARRRGGDLPGLRDRLLLAVVVALALAPFGSLR